ncbi:hypothetical protein GCM10027176_25550 [Actinoallomurus bryophytorum]|uniref:Uncharacterized protein n=1 Tax=Actinoallomurus bryophytorum TaxID=1490222 RepID=A0A543CPG7_9ACTN|nr:hypothetical protein [Actinoallomurus bryophytorum]TQL98992.1 hypothetical protein FB559_4645 [Actinoallomurus bryophytorum]
MDARAEMVIGKAAPRSRREQISESVAEDHARLLEMVGQSLAEIGIRAALTTFHHLVAYGGTFVLPSRYEPELQVFWPGDHRGIALRVKLTSRDGGDVYAWGASRAQAHPASDPAGAVRLITDAVVAV